MKTVMTTFKKTLFVALFLGLLSGTVNATVFTALVSGNFSSTLTWGGVAPLSMLTSDIVIIPSGITVTLDGAQSFTGTSSLMINGTLTSGSYLTSLTMTGGTLSGSGSLQLDSLVLNMASGISYTGSLTAQSLISMGANLTSSANVTVSNSLTLASGTLNVAAGTLTLGAGSTINVAGGMLTATGIGSINLTNPYNVSYVTSSATSGIELTGTGLHNVTVDATGAVTMSADATVHGVLTLANGTLMLNGNNLTLGSGADVAASGLGTLSGTLTSDLTIATTGSLTGTLRFVSGGNDINNLVVNMAAGSTATLGSNLTINGMLKLMSGQLMLGANNLLVNASGTVSGGSATSYVVTNSTGSLMRNLVAGATDTFNIGTTLNYAPMVVSAGSGSSSGNVAVNLTGQVLANGTSGSVISATNSMVSATWYVSSDATGAISYNMTAMWNAGMEVNGFDRTQAYISHYTGGSWDMQALSASASAGAGMYSMTRTGITSLSPFRVADKNSTTGIRSVAASNNDVTAYPNPTTGQLNFINSDKINTVEIYNVLGKLVQSSDLINNSISVTDLPSGMYFAHIASTNNSTVVKFSKQ